MVNALKARADELYEEARSKLASITKRREAMSDMTSTTPPLTHAEQLRAALSGWASQCPEEFSDHLDHAILSHNRAAAEEAMNQRSPNFELGAEFALRLLRQEFSYWAGRSAKDPAEE